jgi:proliferating cell nuclear antigen
MSNSSNLLEAKISVSKLRDILTPISVLVDECKINISPAELEIRAVDPANVCMVDVRISKDGFDEYESEKSVIGVDLDRFQDIIKMGSSDSEVRLRANKETQMLNIEVENVSYSLSLIDPDSIRDGPDIPDIDLDSSVEIEGSYISQGIKAASMVSDHVELSFDSSNSRFIIRAEGDTDDVEVEHGDDRSENLSAPSDASSLYSLEYLEKISKAVGGSQVISLSMQSEKPVRIEYDISDGDGKVVYMLAPRIQD